MPTLRAIVPPKTSGSESYVQFISEAIALEIDINTSINLCNPQYRSVPSRSEKQALHALIFVAGVARSGVECSLMLIIIKIGP